MTLRICENCGRMSQEDFAKKYCPVKAINVRLRMPMDGCKAYIPLDHEDSVRERRPVSQEGDE